MSNDSVSKTIIVALGVCLVCSILVSTAAVALKPRQDKNKKLEKIVNILKVGGLYEKGVNAEKVFKEKIQPAIIDLETGEALPPEKTVDLLSPEKYDIKRVSKHSEYGKTIPAKEDLAGIKRMPRFLVVYYVKGETGIGTVILPVVGKGLWSTLYGFVALDKDLKTVKGFTIYEHGETPGLGGEVDNPKWKGQWTGKIAFDDNGEFKLEVIKGLVDPGKDSAKYQVDGLSGSTLTTRGVDNMIKFWFGNSGFGTFLKKLREEGIHG